LHIIVIKVVQLHDSTLKAQGQNISLAAVPDNFIASTNTDTA
jgi:hypothetical protein